MTVVSTRMDPGNPGNPGLRGCAPPWIVYRADVIEVFKILRWFENVDPDRFF